MTPSGLTPIQFSDFQDVSVDFTASLKELHGARQMPIAVGRGATISEPLDLSDAGEEGGV